MSTTLTQNGTGRGALRVERPKRFRRKDAWAQQRLDDFGIEGVCSALLNGDTMIGLSQTLKIDLNQLLSWILVDQGRTARMRECRAECAIIWDERCELLIANSADMFELQKARELAHHYRWRASKIAPRIYGDHARIEHTGAAGGPIVISTGLPQADIPKTEGVPTDGVNADGTRVSG
jgi:hypothetical protein